MKNAILLFLFTTFVTANSEAQNKPGDRIRSLEIGYLTKELRLTPEEAEKFWPLYNKYKKELRSIPDSSETLEKQQEVLNIRKKYKKDFSDVLDGPRSQGVYDAEDRLRVLVKKELEERRNKQQKFRN